MIQAGDRVAFSTSFIRSIGCTGWQGCARGRVKRIEQHAPGFALATVTWDDGEPESTVNPLNLVTVDQIEAEARRVEHDPAHHVPGLVIGSPAYALPLGAPPTRKSFWSYHAATVTPDHAAAVAASAFAGTRAEWESFSPGMRREIVRSAPRERPNVLTLELFINPVDTQRLRMRRISVG